jgi:hypothetical protein
VSDVEPELRTLLREKAEKVQSDARIPRPVLRRSRRRRVVTGLLAGALTVGAVAALFVGARFLVQETTEPREVRPAGTPTEFYPFIYPPTQAELDTTVAEVAQGSMPMWTEPEGAAALFAVNVMGWDPNDVEASVRSDDPITAVITNPSLNEAAGSPTDLRTVVYLELVPGADPPMYAVLAAQVEDMDLEPVGPDDQFGTDGPVAFRGVLRVVPDGVTILPTVDDVEGTTASPTPDGRFRFALIVDDPIRPSSLFSVALLDRKGRTLALTSSRLATAIRGSSEAQGSTGAQARLEAIPAAVLETRQAIVDAAQALDWEALRALIPEEGFTFSFGGDSNPIAFWKRVESQGHVPVIGDILPMILGTEPARMRNTYIWPAPAGKDPSEWTPEDEAILDQLASAGVLTERENRDYQEFGYYYGWRVGIDRDGTWVFFVSGD